METITKIDYLKKVCKEKYPIFNKDWYFKAFTLPDLIDENEEKLGDWSLVLKPNGMYCITDDRKLMKISDWVKGVPLYDHQEVIPMSKGELPHIRKDIETKVGSLLMNAVIFHGVEDRVDYINTHKVTPSDYEDYIVPKVINRDEKVEGGIYVDEMLEIFDRMRFFGSLASIFVTAATEPSITPAKGIDDFKKFLLETEEFKGKLNDPVTLVNFTKRLNEYDNEYLKDDPVVANVFVGKTRVGRDKMYNLYGVGLDFIKDPSNDTLIMDSMSEGINTNENQLPKYFNDARAASFFRGDKTALGGYTYELLQKSIASLEITNVPCNTKQGLVKVMTKQELAFAIGRYYKKGTQWVLIRNRAEANALADQTVEMRSPMYCKTEGNKLCYACVSLYYKDLPNGATSIASEISSTLLNMFLKMMHGIKTETIKIDKFDLIN